MKQLLAMSHLLPLRVRDRFDCSSALVSLDKFAINIRMRLFLYHRGWPALGDEYCNVGRRRSWTWIKLAPPACRRRARPGLRPGHLALLASGPKCPAGLVTTPLTGTRTRRRARRPPRAPWPGRWMPWGGSRKGSQPDRARISHRRISP